MEDVDWIYLVQVRAHWNLLPGVKPLIYGQYSVRDLGF
jgi:hypothetical protein